MPKFPAGKNAVSLLAAYVVSQANVHDANHHLAHSTAAYPQPPWLQKATNTGAHRMSKMPKFKAGKHAVLLLAAHQATQAYWPCNLCRRPMRTTLSQRSRSTRCRKLLQPRWSNQATQAYWPVILCRRPLRTTLSQRSRTPHCRKLLQARW